MALRIESVRARLTLFYVVVLALVLIVVGGLIYVLLARALYARIDENLHAFVQIAATSLGNDLDEGQDAMDAARSTARELASRRQMLAIYDWNGTLVAESGTDDDLKVELPPTETIPLDEPLLETLAELRDPDDRHRLAMRRVEFQDHDARYVVVAGSSLEPTDEELEALRGTLAYVVPNALVLAGLGGWFLAHRSLAPVVAMAERARRLGGEDLSGRLPVVNPRDELGQLAATFNELLARLESAITQQRRFMADASHELRTPITTVRTAANVALQQPHREEDDYRQVLSIVEQQAGRLSRIVDDMFMLARADAGNYPVRLQPLHLDELVVEVVTAARIVARTRGVTIETNDPPPAPIVGDEELLQRLLVNLLDNAVRYSPSGGRVDVELHGAPGTWRLIVRDQGPGIPKDSHPQIFERFYRVDASRTREQTDRGAGLGLAMVKWVAAIHGGEVVLTQSSEQGSVFTVVLPASA